MISTAAVSASAALAASLRRRRNSADIATKLNDGMGKRKAGDLRADAAYRILTDFSYIFIHKFVSVRRGS
jgi:hypothetical protein